MRQTVLTAAFLLLPLIAGAQVPPGADSLGTWEDVTPNVQIYADGADTLYALDDSTWVAMQDTISIGCDMPPEGQFWVFQPEPRTRKWVSGPDTTLQYSNLQAMYECVDEVQWLWRYKEGLIQ